jgi:glutamyl-tRNA reductase
VHMMLVGLNYRTTPIEVREQVSISDVELDEVLAQMRNTRTVLESVVVSTCNRTEVYAVVTSVRAGEDFLRTFMQRRAHLTKETMDRHLYVYRGEEAATHLMKVSAGLDSMVIGETQILGQVRTAFLVASDAGNTGALLNQLFRKVIQLGKRAQTETTIGQSPVSVSYAAVQLAKKIFGDLTGRRVLVVGAGKMSQLTAQHLHAAGIHELKIVNRTYEKAVQLAELFKGIAIHWSELESALVAADIVISSTGSKGIVITADMLENVWKHRSKRPFALIDIAVPRDIDPAAAQQRNVYLYDIDDLEGVVAANLAERQRQSVEVEKMIQETLSEYNAWLAEQEVVPLIRAIRAKGEDIQSSVMESLRHKLPNLTDKECDLIHKHTMSIVNQLLRDPIQNMKELSISAGGVQHVQVFAQLFGISAESLARTEGVSLFTEEDMPSPTKRESAGFTEIVKQWSETVLRDAGDGRSTRNPVHPVLR